MLRYLFAALVISAPLGLAAASGFPRPQHQSYLDSDPQAFIHVPGLQDEARFKVLRRQAARGRTTVEGLAALAYAHSIRGNAAEARSTLSLALDYASQRRKLRQHVLWSAGWTHLHLGDYSAAAQAWVESAELHQGRPRWLAYSMAVLAELDGHRVEALEWYSAAARSQARWTDAEEIARTTGHWQPKEREALHGLFLAWQAEQAPALEIERPEPSS